MDDLIARIAADAGVDPEIAGKSVGMILAFLRDEAPKEEVDTLFSAIPGAAEAAAASGSEAGEGGLMGLAGRLMGLGLDMGEMQSLGSHVFAFAREKIGDEGVGQIVSAVPGLSQFL